MFKADGKSLTGSALLIILLVVSTLLSAGWYVGFHWKDFDVDQPPHPTSKQARAAKKVSTPAKPKERVYTEAEVKHLMIKAAEAVQPQKQPAANQPSTEDAKTVINDFMSACSRGDEAAAAIYLSQNLYSRSIFGTNVAGAFANIRPTSWTIKAFERCGSTFRANVHIDKLHPDPYESKDKVERFTLMLFDRENGAKWEINSLNDW